MTLNKELQPFRITNWRRASLLVIFVLPFYLSAQWDHSSETLQYERSYDLDARRPEIKKAAYAWISYNFSDSDDKIKVNTVDEIVARSEFPVNYFFDGFPVADTVNFRLRTEIKDGNYKVTVDSIRYNKNGFFVSTSEISLSGYKILLKDQAESSNTITKKSVNSQLENSELLERRYQEHLNIQRSIIGSIKEEIEKIVYQLSFHIRDALSGSTGW